MLVLVLVTECYLEKLTRRMIALLKEVFVLRKAKLEEHIHDLISTEIIISNTDYVSISCPFVKFPIQTNYMSDPKHLTSISLSISFCFYLFRGIDRNKS